MPYLNVRGNEHYYQWVAEGSALTDKPTMVFLHGWGGSARYWQETARYFAADFNCLLYDLRGFGRSRLARPINLDYELETYADDLAALFEQLDIERAIVQAHSTGASIAALFAARYPERVRQLILCCSGIFEYDERTFKTFHQVSRWVVGFRPGWLDRIPGVHRLFMARFLHRPIDEADSRDFLSDYLIADGEAALGTVYTAVSERAATTMPSTFARLSVPTLLIAGERDIIIPANLGRKAAQLNERIEFVCLKDTAHFPMLEDSQTYRDRVKEFLYASAR